jgi:Zn-dependent protease with chaperone function
MGAVVMGIVAVLLAALLVVAVSAAGGWRRGRPATAVYQAPALPVTHAAGLDGRRWRIRTVADVLQLVLVAALGLTPLGARFVHLVAPRGDTWHAAAAWLLILAAVTAVARLPMLWWRRQMRRTTPELFRPRGGPRRQLARAALVAAGLLNLVLWVFVLVFDVRGDADHTGLSLALAVTTWLLVLIRVIRFRWLPRSDRLSDMVSSLPGGPRIPVVSGWLGTIANMGVVGLRRRVIVVAPPIAAALTDRELRPLLAHEVAHVQHGDVRRRVLRRLLLTACVLAALVALYGIPALRSLAGLRGRLSVQAGPFVLAVYYLVFRVLYAIELRATRAEEVAADRGMISLTGDQDACTDGLGRLSSLLGIPDAWTAPQRLLFATHPATSERLWLLRDPAPVADAQPRAATAGRKVRRRLLAGVLVLAAVVAVGAASEHRAIPMPADAGKYRMLLPRSLDKAPLDTTSTDAVQLRSSVWGIGYLTRFPGAVPVTAVYDQDGQPWLSVWGAYGKLADPSGELSAFWNKFGTLPFGVNAGPADTEPAGPHGGYLQCVDSLLTCAWADDSGIVVMSLSSPGPQSGVLVYSGATITEQELAAMTLSLRAAAEVPAK